MILIKIEIITNYDYHKLTNMFSCKPKVPFNNYDDYDDINTEIISLVG